MDAHELGISENDVVSVKSKHTAIDIVVKLTTDVPRGIVAVPTETPGIKGLFDFEIDSDIVNFIPTEVEICRKG
jgi:anaerobic selenocysteine-containing dehydrogenase